jgi:hypothetical protein
MSGLQGLLLSVVDAPFQPQDFLVLTEGLRDASLPVGDLLSGSGKTILHLLELGRWVLQLGFDELGVKLRVPFRPDVVAWRSECL